MQPLVTEHVLINGSRIAHHVTPGEGQAVVLVHGTPSSSLIWRNIVPSLVGAGYKVHLFDLLGYGLSERPWDTRIDTSITGQVSVLEGLLEHWHLVTAENNPTGSKFHLVAHDIGGAIAQRLAILSRYKSDIRSLTLIDSVSFDSYPSKLTLEMMHKGLDKLLQASDSDHRAHFRDWLLSAVVNRERFEAGSLPVYLDYVSGPIGQGSLIHHQIGHYDPKHTVEIQERYHELGCFPVKLIWGKQDAWQVVGWAERLRDAIPGSTLSVVEGAGHFSLEDQPEEVAGILIAHLGQCS